MRLIFFGDLLLLFLYCVFYIFRMHFYSFFSIMFFFFFFEVSSLLHECIFRVALFKRDIENACEKSFCPMHAKGMPIAVLFRIFPIPRLPSFDEISPHPCVSNLLLSPKTRKHIEFILAFGVFCSSVSPESLRVSYITFIISYKRIFFRIYSLWNVINVLDLLY